MTLRVRRILAQVGLASLLAVALSACTVSGGTEQDSGAGPESLGEVEQALTGGWMLTFVDNFDGTTLDRNNWTPMNLPAGAFNGEWQQYVDDEGSSGTFDVAGDGMLRIYVRYNGGGFGGYKSARIVSKNKVEKSQGAWETRIKLWKSAGAQGLWPAVWFLGHNINQSPVLHSDETVCWPMYNPNDTNATGAANEIDLFEAVTNTGLVQGNFIKDWGGGCEVYDGRNFVTPYGVSLYDWHTYRLEWSGDNARLLVDGATKRTLAAADWNNVWDNKYFVLMNEAIGGNLGGTVSFGPNDSAGMAVDYVKHFTWDDSAGFPDTTKTYKLKSLWDNYVLTAKDRSGNNARATMAVDYEWSSQQWSFVSAGSGNWYIRSAWSGKELVMKDEAGNYNSPAFNVTMDTPAAVASHQFQVIQDAAGKYTIVSGYGVGLTSVDAGSDGSRNYRRAAGRWPDATKSSHRWVVSASE